jgi:hypothetical protein
MWTAGGQRDHLTHGALRKGGGGGAPPPPPPTYTDPVSGMVYNDTGSLNAAIQARNTAAQQKSDADAAAAAAQKAQDDATFQTNKTNAINNARTQVNAAFQNAGVDPSQYGSFIDPTINQYASGITDASSLAGAFPSSLGQDIVNQATTAARNTATGSLNKEFSGDFATSNLADTSVDPFVSQIVNEQFDPLTSQLVNAHNRGTLNDSGFAAANNMLNQKKSAAMDTVRGFGMNVLGTDRGALNDYITSAKNSAGAINLGDTFDPTSYLTQARNMVNTDLSGLGGAIRNQVGGTQFADLPTLLNAGGVVQGPNNPGVTNPAAGVGAATLGSSILDDQKRGLGSTGAF